jgi:nitroreductase
MDTVELAQLIKSRRSIRAWQNKPVPEELLVQAIELATWAPNGGNDQNWFFHVILNKDTINAVADAIQSAQSSMKSWMAPPNAGPPAGSPPAGAGNSPPTGGHGSGKRDDLRNAPALIVVSSKDFEPPMDKIIAEKAQTNPQAKQVIDGLRTVASRIQSAAAATAYLLLVLHQLGLGAVWMTGPMQAKAEIEKTLKVSPDWDVLSLIPVGYPADNPVNDRKPVNEVISVIK